ncbi:hypothetical protein L6164_023993 [Bauhinia variegata]|uniref:Uncharacterized protein n=1 Tax=Bauhinia variegata TaxID=167791 RepID=A0ACB9LWB8_BAUVA|nr:hypothetical protein L6164_023993 [Bauhinia variegata]
MNNEVTSVCHIAGQINSNGVWMGDDPLSFSLPLLLLQLSLVFIVTRCICLLLKPLGQPSIVCDILGGMTLGPSILGRSPAFTEKVFPARARSLLETFAFFGFMLFVFLVGVKIDPSIVLRSDKRALVIGVLLFFVPFVLAGSVAYLLYQFASLDHDVSKALQIVVAIQCLTAFPVITCFLYDLQILNSEIGRLASTSSLVSDICFLCFMAIKFTIDIAAKRSVRECIGSFLSCVMLILFIVFLVRPAVLWVIQRTPQGKPVKETYIFGVLMVVMFCGFMGEVVGLNACVASFVLGLAIPDGLPLGAALVDTLDCFVSVLLMPIFFMISGLMTDVYAIRKMNNVAVILLIICVAFCGKFIATLLPLLLCRMPFRDVISLSLIMNSKGTVELALLILSKTQNLQVLNEECFSIMVLSLVLMSVILAPLVNALYDPSKRFLAYKRRTLLHHSNDEELRILACIHNHDNMLAILNLLAASNATEASSIELVVLHLVKLVGRASSLLVAQFPSEKIGQDHTQSEKIFNAFRKLGEQHKGHLTLHCYKGISPHTTMHNDVCYLALERRIALIIIPFHKRWIVGRRVESSLAYWHLNKNVLEKAPCSVGVLIDHGNQKKFWSEHAEASSTYKVAVYFFGGPDDREGLAYAKRMMEHPNVYITLFHFTSSTEIVSGSARSKMLDTNILSEFRLNAFRNDRVSYREEQVRNGRSVLDVIESMDSVYDLVMVGRTHGDSQLMSQLREWRRGELGCVGELLATIDIGLETSVLVLQQQTRVWGLRDPEDSTHLRRVSV